MLILCYIIDHYHNGYFSFAQNGFVSSIRPHQITYIVPGIEVIEYSDIADFAKKAEELLVHTMYDV